LEVKEPARVRFHRDADAELLVLEVDLPTKRQAGTALDGVVRDLKLRVVHSELEASLTRRVRRLYLSERDGSPVSEARRLEIQTRVLAGMLASTFADCTPPSAYSLE